MTQFSTTRVSDKATAITSNAQLQPAMTWLRVNTPMSRLTELEVYEILQAIAASGSWVRPQFNSTLVP